MGTTKDYTDYVLENISGHSCSARKTFGEYPVYVEEKPVFLVCDNTVFFKKNKKTELLFSSLPCGFPYEGAKEHFIADIENGELTEKIISAFLN